MTSVPEAEDIFIRTGKEQSKSVEQQTRKSAIARTRCRTIWGDAFKYELATSVIVIPVILAADWFFL